MTEVIPGFWLFATAGGALLLGIGIALGIWASGHTSRSQAQMSEEGARELYHKDEAERRANAPAGYSRDASAGSTGEAANVRNAGRGGMKDPPGKWDSVDETSDESFPASDPPGRY